MVQPAETIATLQKGENGELILDQNGIKSLLRSALSRYGFKGISADDIKFIKVINDPALGKKEYEYEPDKCIVQNYRNEVINW